MTTTRPTIGTYVAYGADNEPIRFGVVRVAAQVFKTREGTFSAFYAIELDRALTGTDRYYRATEFVSTRQGAIRHVATAIRDHLGDAFDLSLVEFMLETQRIAFPANPARPYARKAA